VQQNNSMAPTRLLFFYKDNDFCVNYYNMHVRKFREYSYLFDLTSGDPEAIKNAKMFGVQAVPCLVLLNMDGYEMQKWQGGHPPDDAFLRVEIGIGNTWGNTNDRRD
jgi:hypothetical protein